jgi:hypothetical protein
MKRTEMRSSAGKKLYAGRDAAGQFEDVQTYERAHGADVKRTSKDEAAARRRKAAKKGAATRASSAGARTKATSKKATKKKASRKATSRR